MIFKLICTISIILLLASLFYWFQWRPSEIRKTCHIYAVEKADEDDGRKDDLFEDEDYKFRLQYCFNKEGLR